MNIHRESISELEDADEDWYRSLLLTGSSEIVFLTVSMKNEVLGFLLSYFSNGKGYVETVAVKGKYRGLSVGSRLLNGLERIALNHHVKVVKLNVKHSNLKALEFYLKHGYSIDGVTLMVGGDLAELPLNLNVKVELKKMSHEEYRRLIDRVEDVPFTWWSKVTERVDIEAYKYYKGEVALAVYSEGRFRGIVEFEPSRKVIVDYLSTSHNNPLNSMRMVLHGLLQYLRDFGSEEIIIPIDSSEKATLYTILSEGFKIRDAEYRLSKIPS